MPDDYIKVFLSYVGDVEWFVEKFSEYFIKDEVMKVFNWKIDGVPAGAVLLKELESQIFEADVFVAFVDQTYTNRIAADELEAALNARADGSDRPLLIPIMLADDGLRWWNKIKNPTRAPTSISEIAYQKFYRPATNRWGGHGPHGAFESYDIQNVRAIRNWVIDHLRGEIVPTAEPPPNSTKESGSTSSAPAQSKHIDHDQSAVVRQRVSSALRKRRTMAA
jgi:hypothetical protein